MSPVPVRRRRLPRRPHPLLTRRLRPRRPRRRRPARIHLHPDSPPPRRPPPLEHPLARLPLERHPRPPRRPGLRPPGRVVPPVFLQLVVHRPLERPHPPLLPPPVPLDQVIEPHARGMCPLQRRRRREVHPGPLAAVRVGPLDQPPRGRVEPLRQRVPGRWHRLSSSGAPGWRPAPPGRGSSSSPPRPSPANHRSGTSISPCPPGGRRSAAPSAGT